MWFKEVKLTGPVEHWCEEKILLVFVFAPRGNGVFEMNPDSFDCHLTSWNIS